MSPSTARAEYTVGGSDASTFVRVREFLLGAFALLFDLSDEFEDFGRAEGMRLISDFPERITT